MNRLIKTICSAALLAVCAVAAHAQEEKQASEFYRAGKFDLAIQAYTALDNQDRNNPYTLYNLGNCYFKSGSLGKAIAYYEKAYRILPRNGDLRYNLSLALKRSGQELVPPGVPPVLHRIYYLFSMDELLGTAWLFSWLGFIAGAAFLLRPAIKKYFQAPLLGLIAAAAVFWIWAGARSSTEAKNQAVVISATADLRSGPGENFPAAASVPEGHLLSVMDSKDGWYNVGLMKEGIKGWIKKENVDAI